MIRALLGGSFDPIHDGHVALIARILGDGLADHVHLVPAAQSPFKDGTRAAAADRLAMVCLAVPDDPHVTVEDCEIARPAPSYTIDTLTALAARHPDDTWRLVVGADHLAAFDRWQEVERLLRDAKLLVFARGDWDGALPPLVAGRATVVRDFAHPASATDIRRDLARGHVPRDVLPPSVADYIVAHALYGLGR